MLVNNMDIVSSTVKLLGVKIDLFTGTMIRQLLQEFVYLTLLVPGKHESIH